MAGTETKRASWLGTILLTSACIVASITKLLARSGLTPEELTDPSRFILQVEWAIVLGLVVLGIVLFLEKLPLSSIGIEMPSWVDMVLAIVLCGLGEQVDHWLRPVLVHLSGISIRIGDAPPILEWSTIIGASVTRILSSAGTSSRASRPSPTRSLLFFIHACCSRFGISRCGALAEWSMQAHRDSRCSFLLMAAGSPGMHSDALSD